MWEDAFLPPVAHWMRDYCEARPSLVAETGAALDGEGLVFSACTRAEGGRGIVLRCYNVLDRAVDGRWKSARPIAAATLVRADETVLAPLPLGPGGGEVAFHAGPYAIVSILLEFTD
jgi:alpha-mannosidase